jgi:hypothetical protein
MGNMLTVTVEFSYQGETHTLSSTLDLDVLMTQRGGLPDFYDWLAEQHGIGPYSYQYEVLLSEEMLFSDAQGMAAEFLGDGRFDAEGFMARWHREQVVNVLQPIAVRELGVSDLAAEPALLRALTAAYRLGRGE